MALTIGIVGLPNVGKSTMFNALTKNNVLAANYPFATIEPNVGVVPLPDERLGVLAEMFSSAKVLPATVSFVDIAGIVRGASEGEGLGNKFLANIREADAICQVVRAFVDDDVTHVDGRIDPSSDMETINTELVLADLQTLETAVPRLEKEVKGKKTDKAVLDTALAARTVLEGGDTLFAKGEAAGVDVEIARQLGLLTTKPFLYVFNVDEDQLTDEAMQAELQALVEPAEAIFLNAKLESEVAELDDEDARELLEGVGIGEAVEHVPLLGPGRRAHPARAEEAGEAPGEVGARVGPDLHEGFVLGADGAGDRDGDGGRPVGGCGAHDGQG